jgi:hypothetical protein
VRGRLLNPFLIELAQLDTEATALVPGGGYDDVFNEPIIIDDGTPGGLDSRQETALRLHAQIEPNQLNSARSAQTGLVRDATLTCVVHFLELESLGLIGADGMPRIRVNDRLAGIYTSNGEQIMVFDRLPGLYLRQTTPIGWGLGGKRNLLELTFRARDQAR